MCTNDVSIGWLVSIVGIVGVLGCGGGAPADELDGGLIAFDAGTDGGAVPVVTSCEGIFDAMAGTTCATWLDCYRGEFFCLRRHAACPEGVVAFEETDRWNGAGGEDVTCGDLGEVGVEGSGPDGPFSFDAGVGSFSHGFSVDGSLVFFEGPDVTACGTPRLEVPLRPIGPEPTYMGDHTVTATLALGDRIVDLTGVVRIDSESRLDDNRLVLGGGLDLIGEIATVHGTFRVVECSDLDRSGL